eukprot:247278-Chlamydomonas_euryale.AAC.1
MLAQKAKTEPSGPVDPQSRSQAMNSANSDDWLKAEADETTNLMSNQTWELFKRPQGAKLLRGRWVYKIKRDAHCNVLRYKAPFVVKRYMQREGIDYDELYAPTARTSSLLSPLKSSRTTRPQSRPLRASGRPPVPLPLRGLRGGASADAGAAAGGAAGLAAAARGRRARVPWSSWGGLRDIGFWRVGPGSREAP